MAQRRRPKQLGDLRTLSLRESPELRAERNGRPLVLEPLLGEMFPGSGHRALHCQAYGLWRILDCIGVLPKSGLIAFDDLLENTGGRHARQIRAARSRRQRQREADDVMSGIADDRLVQIPYLDGNASIDCCDRSEIADMTISAYPHRRSFGQGAAFLTFQPFVEFYCAAADIRMRRASHFHGLSQL